MPLSPKVRTAPSDIDRRDKPATDPIAENIHREVEKATIALQAQIRKAEARLHRSATHANKRILATGRRAVREARHPPLPVTPLAIGLGIILGAYVFGPRKRPD